MNTLFEICNRNPSWQIILRYSRSARCMEIWFHTKLQNGWVADMHVRLVDKAMHRSTFEEDYVRHELERWECVFAGDVEYANSHPQAAAKARIETRLSPQAPGE